MMKALRSVRILIASAACFLWVATSITHAETQIIEQKTKTITIVCQPEGVTYYWIKIVNRRGEDGRREKELINATVDFDYHVPAIDGAWFEAYGQVAQIDDQFQEYGKIYQADTGYFTYGSEPFFFTLSKPRRKMILRIVVILHNGASASFTVTAEGPAVKKIRYSEDIETY